jgi:hypothetical protein
MSYKITIEETREIKKLVGKEWATLGTKEVERDERYYAREKDEPKTRIEEVRGYTPEIEKTVTETRQILVQVVDELDLSDVIRAINGLKS